MVSTDSKPFRARLRPLDPARDYVVRRFQAGVGGKVFKQGVWYKLTEEEAHHLEKKRQHNDSPKSPPLFEVLSIADYEATVLDERRRARNRDLAAQGLDPEDTLASPEPVAPVFDPLGIEDTDPRSVKDRKADRPTGPTDDQIREFIRDFQNRHGDSRRELAEGSGDLTSDEVRSGTTRAADKRVQPRVGRRGR